jgi:hypothetical protein
MTDFRKCLLAMELEYTLAMERCRKNEDGLGASHVAGALEAVRRMIRIVHLRTPSDA